MTLQEWRRKLNVLKRAEYVACAKVGPWLKPGPERDAVHAAATAAQDALTRHFDNKPVGYGEA